jgi:thiol:disulfide interchange protein DsbD
LKYTTFKDVKVQEVLKNEYVALSVNISDSSDEDRMELKKMFGIFGPPGFVFVGSDGEVMKSDMFYGYEGPDEFYDTLDLIAE